MHLWTLWWESTPIILCIHICNICFTPSFNNTACHNPINVKLQTKNNVVYIFVRKVMWIYSFLVHKVVCIYKPWLPQFFVCYAMILIIADFSWTNEIYFNYVQISANKFHPFMITFILTLRKTIQATVGFLELSKSFLSCKFLREFTRRGFLL